MRVSLGVALGAALMVAGAAAPGMSATPPTAAASPDVAVAPAPPAGSTTASVSARTAAAAVTAKISLPPGSSVNGSITGTLTITHDGTSSEMRSGRITMVDPDGRELLGEQFVATGTPDTWTSTVPLPEDAAPGLYDVSLNATVAVTTDDGVTEVPIRTQTPITVPFRAQRNIPLIWTSPSSAPAGADLQVHGAANQRSLGTGEYEPATGQQVKLYFDPDGSAPEALRATLTTDARGYFTSRQKPGASGKWRAEMPQTDTGAKTVWTITSAERERTTTLRQGQVQASQGGYTAGDRLVTHDVVVGLAPVHRRVDVGSLNFSIGGRSGWVSAESRRAEGSYPNGYRMQRELVHAGIGTSHVTLTFNATLPAGVYDIGVRDAMKACGAPVWDGLEGGTSSCTHDVLVEDPTVTTVVVKRASSTTLTASKTSLPAPGTVTLSGEVRKVQLVSGGGAQERPAPNTTVEIWFDPAGSAEPVLKKTIKTGSTGTYSTNVTASGSGAWSAKYPGTNLQASSQAKVNISVG